MRCCVPYSRGHEYQSSARSCSGNCGWVEQGFKGNNSKASKQTRASASGTGPARFPSRDAQPSWRHFSGSVIAIRNSLANILESVSFLRNPSYGANTYTFLLLNRASRFLSFFFSSTKHWASGTQILGIRLPKY
jgi:hypothetical protein